MKTVVNSHTTKKQKCKGQHGGIVFELRKTVDGKTLVVAAEIKATECWIMTGYLQ